MLRAGFLTILFLSLTAPGAGTARAGEADKPPVERPDRPSRPDDGDDEGELARFEDEATRPEKVRKDSPHGCGGCGSDAEDAAVFFLVDITWGVARGVGAGLLYGGYASMARVADVDRYTPEGEEIPLPPRRETGDPLLPFLALEGFAQPTHDGISATGGRAEVGFGPLAVEGRFTRYSEAGFPAHLDLVQVHGLYRMSLGAPVELDLGYGTAALYGQGRHAGFSMTYPVRVYPVHNLGVEFRPSWAWLGGATLSDHTLAVTGTAGYLSLRAGYRWTRAGSANLDGPVLGATLHF
jgi:hypothetical protein